MTAQVGSDLVRLIAYNQTAQFALDVFCSEFRFQPSIAILTNILQHYLQYPGPTNDACCYSKVVGPHSYSLVKAGPKVLQSYNVTVLQSSSHTNIVIQPYSVAVIQSYINMVLHSYSHAFLHYYSLTVVQTYSHTLLQPYSHTLIQAYSLTVLHY